jgi:hypothetical protein
VVWLCIVVPQKNMGGCWEAKQTTMDKNARGVQTVFHDSKDGAEPACEPGYVFSTKDAACVTPAELKKSGDCAWGTAEVVDRKGKKSCVALNLPPGQPCPVVNMQRPTWLDPASKIQIADRPRWAGGLLADKAFINAVKLQGAMEAMQALAPAGVTPYAALTKKVGHAQPIVSHLGITGQQGMQSYGRYPYGAFVPATGAVSVAPTAAALFKKTGF